LRKTALFRAREPLAGDFDIRQPLAARYGETLGRCAYAIDAHSRAPAVFRHLASRAVLHGSETTVRGLPGKVLHRRREGYSMFDEGAISSPLLINKTASLISIAEAVGSVPWLRRCLVATFKKELASILAT